MNNHVCKEAHTRELLELAWAAREERLAAMGFDTQGSAATAIVDCGNAIGTMPGCRVVTPLGTGYVVAVDKVTHQVSIELDSGSIVSVDIADTLVVADG